MQENTEGGERLLDADAANRLAQQLNDRAQGLDTPQDTSTIPTESYTPDVGSRPVSDTTSQSDSLETQEVQAGKELYPPDAADTVDVGGSPEDQGVLRDEFRRS